MLLKAISASTDIPPPLTLIRRRYEKCLGIAKEDFDRSFSLVTLSRKLKEVKPNIRASCTKAVIFSWCTGSRFQNKEKQCILGCDAADHMEHYCQCPPLWEGIAFATRSHFKIAESARERWGIEGWSSEGVLTLAIATATFQQLSHSSSDPAAAASAAMRSFGLLNDARPQHGPPNFGSSWTPEALTASPTMSSGSEAPGWTPMTRQKCSACSTEV